MLCIDKHIVFLTLKSLSLALTSISDLVMFSLMLIFLYNVDQSQKAGLAFGYSIVNLWFFPFN